MYDSLNDIIFLLFFVFAFLSQILGFITMFILLHELI